jgi:hypothetical protein
VCEKGKSFLEVEGEGNLIFGPQYRPLASGEHDTFKKKRRYFTSVTGKNNLLHLICYP